MDKINNLEGSIKKASYISNFIAIVLAVMSALGIGFGFYYDTNSQLKTNTERIETLESNVDKTTMILNEMQIFKGVSGSEIKNIEKKVDKIDEKLDKLLLMQK